MKNWKTTLAALILALSGVAVSLGWIPAEVGTAIITIAGALGFAVAKDHNVSGK